MGMPKKHIAVIDLGSNSVRVVIYAIDECGAIHKLDDLKRTLRLSSYIDKTGFIVERGITELLQCLKQFKQLCQSWDVDHIKGAATAALRQARNGREIIFRIVKETGIHLDILSGMEEARYGFLAVRHTMDIDEAIIVDVGGGSTEISYMKERRLLHSISLPFGAVNMTDRYFRGIETVPQKYIDQVLIDFYHELSKVHWLAGKQCPLIGLGGTARSLAAIHQAKVRYSFDNIHHYQMAAYDIKLLVEYLRKVPLARRSTIEGLSSGREDIIIGGSVIFAAILEYCDLEALYISNYGLRDGICYEILQQETASLHIDDAISNYVKHFAYYKINQNHAEHVRHLSVGLYQQLVAEKIITARAADMLLLQIAAYLHDVGRTINIHSAHSHTFYLLTNVNIPRLTHKQQIMIALIASYKKTKVLRERMVQFSDILEESDELSIHQMGTIVLLARSLDRTVSEQTLGVRLLKEGNQYVLECSVKRKNSLEIDLAGDWLKRFKKYFGYDLSIRPIKNGQGKNS